MGSASAPRANHALRGRPTGTTGRDATVGPPRAFSGGGDFLAAPTPWGRVASHHNLLEPAGHGAASAAG